MIDDTIKRCQKDYWDNTSTLTTAWKNGRQEGLEQGRQEGLEKGIKREKLDTVRKMLARGFSVEDIAEIAGLPLKEIDATAH